MQMTAEMNELPPGALGRHGFFVGEWSESLAKYLDEAQFLMATFEGSWGDCSFFQQHGKSIRWLRIVNTQKRLDGVRFLPALETLSVGFEPKDISPLLCARSLKALEIIAKKPGPLLCHSSLERLKLIGATEFRFECENHMLQSLHLVRPHLDSLRTIAPDRALQTLDVFGAKDLSSLDGVDSFPKLEVLGIETCSKLVDINHLAFAKSLRRLSIIRCPVTELPLLAAHPSLEFLHIGGRAIRVSWEDLFLCRSLHTIAILVPDELANAERVEDLAKNAGREIEELSILGGKEKFVKLKLL
jgi:hypothetical protein